MHGCSLHRLRDWLTYRALPVPCECKRRRTCTACLPQPGAYLAVRYPHGGHTPAQHAALPSARPVNNVQAPVAPIPLPPPTPLNGALNGAPNGVRNGVRSGPITVPVVRTR